MLGRAIPAELIHPDDADAGWEMFRGMAAGTDDHYTIEQRFLHRTGEQRWLRLAMSLVRDAEGRPKNVIGMGEDITERKLAEEQRNGSRRRWRRRATWRCRRRWPSPSSWPP